MHLIVSRVVVVSFVTSVSDLYQFGAGNALTPGINEVNGKDPSGFSYGRIGHVSKAL